MPQEKNGKISLNLKLSKEQYDKWVAAACEQQELNMSRFIRNAVDTYISLMEKN